MKKVFISAILAIALLVSRPLKADMWGADIPILLEILTNSINQLYQLYEVVNNGEKSLSLMRDLNSGVNDALNAVQIIKSSGNPGAFGDWKNVDQALRNLQSIYGMVPKSSNSKMQQDSDRSAAEAIAQNNQIYSYANSLDKVGEQIEIRSQVASPKGAAKLTAQGIGVITRAMNEQLKVQGTSLKLQAQSLAANNKQEKEETKAFLNSTSTLAASMKDYDSKFQTPRF